MFLDSLDISAIPTPLCILLNQYEGEEQPFRKVHRLIDIVEWIFKWHSALAVSDVMREAKLTPRLKILFSSGLRRPSLGTWMTFYRESVRSIDKPLIPYDDWCVLNKLDDKHHLVAFRNHYAHGATERDEKCLADCMTFGPVVSDLLCSPLFCKVKLAVSGENGVYIFHGFQHESLNLDLAKSHCAAILPDGDSLDLWPICIYVPDKIRQTGEQFFYFNSIRSRAVEQLNYELPVRQRDRDFKILFDNTFPLREWRRTDDIELHELSMRIQALADGFRGRIEERHLLHSFCHNGEGAMMIWGNPGLGKSALVSQVVLELKSRADSCGQDPYDKRIPVIEYLARRGYSTAKLITYLEYLCKKLDSIFDLAERRIGIEENEIWNNIQQRIRAIDELSEKPSVLLVVDGLDESPGITSYIPAPRSWLRVMLTSRPVESVTDWWKNWECQCPHKKVLNLRKLHTEEIRSILLDVVDKYHEGFTQEFVSQVEHSSEGNPLYLRLLCDCILARGGQVSSMAEIPSNIKEMFEVTLKRVTDGGANQYSFDLLLLLAAAEAPLSSGAVSEFLEINEIQSEIAVESTRELLSEEHAGKDSYHYQLFHGALGEWLSNRYPRQVQTMKKLLADRCQDYHSLEDDRAKTYALEFAGYHLAEQDDYEKLWALLRDEDFRRAQIESLERYSPSLEDLKRGIRLYADRDGENPEDDGRLCWLALRAGKLPSELISMLAGDSFDCGVYDEQTLEMVLSDLVLLDDPSDLFVCYAYLVYLEAKNQIKKSPEERLPRRTRKILNAIERKFHGYQDPDCGDLCPTDAMAWLVRLLVAVFPDLDFSGMVYGTYDLRALLLSITKLPSPSAKPADLVSFILKIMGRMTETSSKFDVALSVVGKLLPQVDRQHERSELLERVLAQDNFYNLAACTDGGYIKRASRADSKCEAEFYVKLAILVMRSFPAEESIDYLKRVLKASEMIIPELERRSAVCSISKIALCHSPTRAEAWLEALKSTEKTFEDPYNRFGLLAYVTRLLLVRNDESRGNRVFGRALSALDQLMETDPEDALWEDMVCSALRFSFSLCCVFHKTGLACWELDRLLSTTKVVARKTDCPSTTLEYKYKACDPDLVGNLIQEFIYDSAPVIRGFTDRPNNWHNTLSEARVTAEGFDGDAFWSKVLEEHAQLASTVRPWHSEQDPPRRALLRWAEQEGLSRSETELQLNLMRAAEETLDNESEELPEFFIRTRLKQVSGKREAREFRKKLTRLLRSNLKMRDHVQAARLSLAIARIGDCEVGRLAAGHACFHVGEEQQFRIILLEYLDLYELTYDEPGIHRLEEAFDELLNEFPIGSDHVSTFRAEEALMFAFWVESAALLKKAVLHSSKLLNQLASWLRTELLGVLISLLGTRCPDIPTNLGDGELLLDLFLQMDEHSHDSILVEGVKMLPEPSELAGHFSEKLAEVLLGIMPSILRHRGNDYSVSTSVSTAEALAKVATYAAAHGLLWQLLPTPAGTLTGDEESIMGCIPVPTLRTIIGRYSAEPLSDLRRSLLLRPFRISNAVDGVEQLSSRVRGDHPENSRSILANCSHLL